MIGIFYTCARRATPAFLCRVAVQRYSTSVAQLSTHGRRYTPDQEPQEEPYPQQDSRPRDREWIQSSLFAAIVGALTGVIASKGWELYSNSKASLHKTENAAKVANACLAKATQMLWMSQQAADRRDSSTALNFLSLASSEVAEADKMINTLTEPSEQEAATKLLRPHANLCHFRSAIAYMRGWVELLLLNQPAQALSAFKSAHMLRQADLDHQTSQPVVHEIQRIRIRVADSHSILQQVASALSEYESISRTMDPKGTPNYWCIRFANNFSVLLFARGCDAQAFDQAKRVEKYVDGLVLELNQAGGDKLTKDDEVDIRAAMTEKGKEEMCTLRDTVRKLSAAGAASVVDVLHILTVADAEAITKTLQTKQPAQVHKFVVYECLQRIKKILRKSLTIRVNMILFSAFPLSCHTVHMADSVDSLLQKMDELLSQDGIAKTTVFAVLNDAWMDREGSARCLLGIAAGLVTLSSDGKLESSMRKRLRDLAKMALQAAERHDARDLSRKESDWHMHFMTFLEARLCAAESDGKRALYLLDKIISTADTASASVPQTRFLRIAVEACLLVQVSTHADDDARKRAQRVMTMSLSKLQADERLMSIGAASTDPTHSTLHKPEIDKLQAWWEADADAPGAVRFSASSEDVHKINNIIDRVNKRYAWPK